VLELYQKRAELSESNLATIAIGFVISFIVAYAVVKSFIEFVGRYGLKPFGWYRIATGVALLAILLR
jgi:undecaprenyl-diphosphatase